MRLCYTEVGQEWSGHAHQIRDALARILASETGSETFLKLNLVPRHRRTLPDPVFTLCTTAVKLRKVRKQENIFAALFCIYTFRRRIVRVVRLAALVQEIRSKLDPDRRFGLARCGSGGIVLDVGFVWLALAHTS
jgi:hypothetical protein